MVGAGQPHRRVQVDRTAEPVISLRVGDQPRFEPESETYVASSPCDYAPCLGDGSHVKGATRDLGESIRHIDQGRDALTLGIAMPELSELLTPAMRLCKYQRVTWSREDARLERARTSPQPHVYNPCSVDRAGILVL